MPHAAPQVLDVIDAGSSALIVAPTSSGKTFISSYCINSVVLREGEPSRGDGAPAPAPAPGCRKRVGVHMGCSRPALAPTHPRGCGGPRLV